MFFFYATGITPAMTQKMVGQGSQYAAAFVDAKGVPLNGGKTYKLHMPPNIPAKDFWSFTVYDNQTRSMLQTDQQFPAVGSARITCLDLTCDDRHKPIDDFMRPRQVCSHHGARTEVSKVLTLIATFQQTNNVSKADTIILINNQA